MKDGPSDCSAQCSHIVTYSHTWRLLLLTMVTLLLQSVLLQYCWTNQR